MSVREVSGAEKESVELVAVLSCARPNRRSRERRVHMQQDFGELSHRCPWSLAPWHGEGRGRWQWARQRMRGE